MNVALVPGLNVKLALGRCSQEPELEEERRLSGVRHFPFVRECLSAMFVFVELRFHESLG